MMGMFQYNEHELTLQKCITLRTWHYCLAFWWHMDHKTMILKMAAFLEFSVPTFNIKQ